MKNLIQTDLFSRHDYLEHILAWFQEPMHGKPDFDELVQFFNFSLPRTLFLKSLGTGGAVIDLGAGEGGLAIYKKWPYVLREDLQLFALSLDIGEYFYLYDGYEIANFEQKNVFFNGKRFDAVVCCHFIEHMHSLDRTFDVIKRMLDANGRIYLEWPHPISARFPERGQIQAKGYEISTCNFFDDGTHVEPWAMDKVIAELEARGFAIETMGRVYLPWQADMLKAHAVERKDSVLLTLATWAKYGWSQYVIAAKR